jgi:hypothetical protein
VKQIPPTDFWNQVDSDMWNLHLLMPALTIDISLLERYFWFGTVTPRGDVVNWPSAYL